MKILFKLHKEIQLDLRRKFLAKHQKMMKMIKMNRKRNSFKIRFYTLCKMQTRSYILHLQLEDRKKQQIRKETLIFLRSLLKPKLVRITLFKLYLGPHLTENLNEKFLE